MSHYSRHQVDDRIDREPGQHHEIPVERVLADIDKTPASYVSCEHQCREDRRVREIGANMRRMEPQERPHNRAIRIRIPLDVERGELKDANSTEDQTKANAGQE